MSSEHIVLDEAAQNLLFREAHTANTFTDEPVGEDQIRALYDLVKWAPTSFNQQPLRVVLVRSEEARARLVPLMIESNQEKTGKAPLVAILAADNEFTEHLPAQFPVFPQAGDLFFADPQVREESAKLNASLQIAYFILGIRALGLAAGPMSGFDAERVNKEFFPDGTKKALVVVNIGKPGTDSFYPRLPRLEFEQVFTTH
jgi:nitroreductase